LQCLTSGFLLKVVNDSFLTRRVHDRNVSSSPSSVGVGGAVFRRFKADDINRGPNGAEDPPGEDIDQTFIQNPISTSEAATDLVGKRNRRWLVRFNP
jgi:hypothetical protein